MQKCRLFRYLLWTFAITYLCWGGLALLIHFQAFSYSHPVATILHLIGGFGPTIAALVVWEGSGIKALIRFVFGCKRKSIFYLLLFCILEFAIIGLSSWEWNEAMPLSLVPVVFLQAVFLYGGNEELGWRGTMQPILEEKLPFPLATLITGIVWSVWHIPLWFVDGASQQNIPFFLFLALGILLSFWLATVYKKTNCVFYCNILHGLTNTLLSLFVIKINAILIIGFVFLLGISIFLWYFPKRLSQKENRNL